MTQETEEKEVQYPESPNFVRVPKAVWKQVWDYTLNGILFNDQKWRKFKQKFDKQPNAYTIRCPKCKHGTVILQSDSQNNFECCECKCKFSITIQEQTSTPLLIETCGITLAIGIGSPTENWETVQNGDSLDAKILDMLRNEEDIWFVKVPENYPLTFEKVEERKLFLMVITRINDRVDGKDVLSQPSLSRLALWKLLRENTQAVIQQTVWISDEQLKDMELEFRRP